MGTYSALVCLSKERELLAACWFIIDTSREIHAPSLARHGVPIEYHPPGRESATDFTRQSRPSASPEMAGGERDATRGRGGVHRQAP